MRTPNRRRRQRPVQLTRRQIEILKHVGRGLTSREIAAKLRLSRRTVEVHRLNLGRRLKLRGRNNPVALIRAAMKQGLLAL